MKKLIFISILFSALSINGFAQSPIENGQSQLNFGLGLSSWGVPLYFGLDQAVHPNITIGGELSFRSYNHRYRENSFNHSIFGASANANYHFNTLLEIPNPWDFYAGLNLGFYHWNSPSGYGGNFNSGIGLGAQIGGRYYLNEKLGLNLELGGGNAFSGGKFGLTYKL